MRESGREGVVATQVYKVPSLPIVESRTLGKAKFAECQITALGKLIFAECLSFAECFLSRLPSAKLCRVFFLPLLSSVFVTALDK